MKHLIIIGARGWGREALWAATATVSYEKGRYDIKGFLDDKSDALDGLKGHYPPILGPVETYEIQEDDVFFCALGDAFYRKKYAQMIEEKGGEFISIISPMAFVSPTATLGAGSFVGSFTIISDNVTIGKHVMIQSFNNFGHDSVIGDYSSIESYVFLGGGASVGEMSTMHTKSSIIPHKSVGRNCVVGIGSVVMRNFKDGMHVFGNPAVKCEI